MSATMPRPVVIRLIAVIVLAAASLALYGFMPAYRDTGVTVLAPGDFGAWSHDASTSANGGALTIRNADTGRIVGAERRVKAPFARYVRLRAELRSSDVILGANAAQGGRLLLAAVDFAGHVRWDLPHVLTQLKDSRDWAAYSAVFAVPEAAPELLLAAQLHRASGTLEMRNVSVIAVTPDRAFTLLSRSLLVLWIVCGLWILFPLAVSARAEPASAGVILVGVAILIATQMPDTDKTALLQIMRDVEHAVARPFGGASVGATVASAPVMHELALMWHGIDKLGHFLMHVLLGAVAWLAFRREHPVLVLVCLLAFAGSTEVLQNFAIGRDPLLSDAAINAAGVLAGSAMVEAWMRFRRSRR
ncbi:MAG TPA: VanZ family protein [Candidatus Cybelea sp.]|nr:VanZ family protein [Candidatus Cybelea sp.]